MVSLLASTDATRGNIQVIKSAIADVDKEIQVMQPESESIVAFLAGTPTVIGSECVSNHTTCSNLAMWMRHLEVAEVRSCIQKADSNSRHADDS